jgi:hypothetical protein
MRNPIKIPLSPKAIENNIQLPPKIERKIEKLIGLLPQKIFLFNGNYLLDLFHSK